MAGKAQPVRRRQVGNGGSSVDRQMESTRRRGAVAGLRGRDSYSNQTDRSNAGIRSRAAADASLDYSPNRGTKKQTPPKAPSRDSLPKRKSSNVGASMKPTQKRGKK